MHYSKRQIRKKQTTEKSLKYAFIDLIIESHYAEQITISEITNRADLNRGTFYIYFKDKEDLLENLYDDAIAGLYNALHTPYINVEKVDLNRIVPSTRLIFEHIEEHKKLFKALDKINTFPDIYMRFEKMSEDLFTTKILFEHEEKDVFEVNYDMFISYQIHATLGVIKYWIKNNFVYSADYMSEQLTSFYTHKITAMNFIREE